MGMQAFHLGHLMAVVYGFRVHISNCDTIQCDMMWKRIQLCSYQFDIQIQM